MLRIITTIKHQFQLFPAYRVCRNRTAWHWNTESLANLVSKSLTLLLFRSPHSAVIPPSMSSSEHERVCFRTACSVHTSHMVKNRKTVGISGDLNSAFRSYEMRETGSNWVSARMLGFCTHSLKLTLECEYGHTGYMNTYREKKTLQTWLCFIIHSCKLVDILCYRKH